MQEQVMLQPSQSVKNNFYIIRKQKPKERVAIFMDGCNFYFSLRRLRKTKINLKNLINEILKNRVLTRIFYYAPKLDPYFNKEHYALHKDLLRDVEKLGNIKIVLCFLKRFKDNKGKIHFQVKGDDIHLANDLLVGAYENSYDTAILITGDEDFIPVVKTLLKLNKKVENYYFRRSSSKRLRRACTFARNIYHLLE